MSTNIFFTGDYCYIIIELSRILTEKKQTEIFSKLPLFFQQYLLHVIYQQMLENKELNGAKMFSFFLLLLLLFLFVDICSFIRKGKKGRGRGGKK
jgi:hypothetical protein